MKNDPEGCYIWNHLETVLQGSFKAPLRERFLAKRSVRNVICLSPEGEFMTLQRSEM
jgi:hypothetical protein